MQHEINNASCCSVNYGRRKLLRVLVVALTSIWMWACSNGRLSERKLNLGRASDYPEGFTFRDLERVAVLRDSQGLRAVLMVCTHQHCALQVKKSGQSPDQTAFICPCHGSIFDQQGRVLRGPATVNLHWLALEVDAEGRLQAYPDKQVDFENVLAV